MTNTCAPGSLEFVNSSTDVSENTVFIWSFFDGSTNETYDYTNAGLTISHLYEKGTINCATQVTLTAENECNTIQGGPSLATFNPLRIWDIDDASISASKNFLCYPETMVSYTNSTHRNCILQGNISQRYEYWNFGDYWGLGYDSIIGWQAWPPSLPIEINYPGVGTYEVMLIDSSFCGLDTAYMSINIIPPPISNLSADKDSICIGETITFQNLSSGIVNDYIWDMGNGNSWTQQWAGDISYTYNTAGTYEVLLIPQISGICRDTAKIEVYVSPIPSANFTIDNDSGCDSMSVNFTDNSSNDVIVWNWNFGNGNTSNLTIPETQDYSSIGTHWISLEVTNSSGCTNTFGDNIIIRESPKPSVTPTNVCVNELVNFEDLTQSIDNIVSWHWDLGNGTTSTLENPTHNFNSAGIFDIVLNVSTSYCNGTDTIEIQVDSMPSAHFITSEVEGCSPLEITFLNQSSSNAIYQTWKFSDTDISILENPTHTFVNNSINEIDYEVSLSVLTSAGCKDSSSLTVTVLPQPIASFYSNAIFDCAPLEVDFTNNSTNALNYEWDLGDNTNYTSTNVSHTFQNQSLLIETFQVSLIASNQSSCKDTSIQTIIAYPEPNFNFSTTPSSGCSPLEIHFPAVNGALIYEWDFGDGDSSSIQSPVHIYLNNSSNDLIYNVELIATSPFGCSDTTSHQINIFPSPTSNFTTSDSLGCSPLSVEVQNNSTESTNNVWNINSGTDTIINTNIFSVNLENNEGNIQTYELKLMTLNDYNCSDTSSKTINVFPSVTANFLADTAGCSPLDLQFYNFSQGINDLTWDFGDGTIINNGANYVNHIFTNNSPFDTTFNTSLIINSEYDCKDTTYKKIHIYPSPIAEFEVSPITQSLPNSTVIINNISNEGDWEYYWEFGDNSNSTVKQPNSHTYNSQGQYQIKLEINSQHNCNDSIYHWITILPNLPIANFLGSGEGCPPLTVQFENTSLHASNFIWDFGDNTYSGLEHPVKIYTNQGEYSVTLTVVNSDGNNSITKENIIKVYDSPTSLFAINKNNSTIETENLSELATDYFWDLGDSFTSNEFNLFHTYEFNGIYTINLIATNEFCSDTSYKTISISESSSGSVLIPNSFTPNKNNNTNNHTLDIGINDVLFPVILGAMDFKMDIFKKWGERLFSTSNQNIGWDGRHNGKLCQTDVYLYSIYVVFENNEERQIVGKITLVN
ncbi:MAG: PKD domain-containing protein [Flavobacteriales bacterium]